MTHEKQNRILAFWFGDDSLHPLQKRDVWFSKNAAFDARLREDFEPLLSEAGTGALDDWAKTAEGALALVVLCDQFTRNMYRGDEAAFGFDKIALRASQIAISHGLDKKMSVIERCFLYLPFEHSEDLAVQDRSVELFKELFEEAHGEEREFIAQALDYAQRHHDIIEKFGRFPHRNEALNRQSTRAEKEFLRRPGSAF